MNIGDLQPGHSLIGLTPSLVCKVVAVNRIADNAGQVIYGTPDVNSTPVESQLNKIAEEVIALLTADPNATVNVTLEIDAEFDRGVDENVKRSVSENADSLGFKTKEWE